MTSIKEQIDQANAMVMDILLNGQPVWTDIRPAGEVVPAMKKNLLLHAGPPARPEDIVAPLRISLCGAAIHEGLAATEEEAWQMILDGRIAIDSAQDYGCSNGASMVICASMPVIVARDTVSGSLGFAALHPGPVPQSLRWGFYNPAVEEDLAWFRDVYGPVLGEAVRNSKGIDIRMVMARTAGMGDENHVRQPAASNAIALDLIASLLESGSPDRDIVIRRLSRDERFFLHVLMAGCMSILQAAKNIPLSTIMVAMGGNGGQFGLQFSGTGSQWFTCPAPKIIGAFLNPSWTEKDICGYLGDSCVTEVYGMGGFSAIAGPAFMRLTGETFADAKRRTEEARAVSLGEHQWAPIPWDNYRGMPVGVDMRLVVAKNISPTSHGGSTRLSGGQGGAGSVVLPIELFQQALRTFSQLAAKHDNQP